MAKEKERKMILVTMIQKKPELYAFISSVYYGVMSRATEFTFQGVVEVFKGLTVIISFLIALVSLYILCKKNFKRQQKYPYVKYYDPRIKKDESSDS